LVAASRTGGPADPAFNNQRLEYLGEIIGCGADRLGDAATPGFAKRVEMSESLEREIRSIGHLKTHASPVLNSYRFRIVHLWAKE
jgi:hypothetical protein